MKNIIYILTILSLCFFGKAQAQDVQWTSQQVFKVEQEIALIQAEVPLAEAQKDFLKTILLEKNHSLEEGIRANHKRKIVLFDIEDVLRYGRPINRHPGQEDLDKATEILTLALYTEKILNNEILLQQLNLLIEEE